MSGGAEGVLFDCGGNIAKLLHCPRGEFALYRATYLMNIENISKNAAA